MRTAKEMREFAARYNVLNDSVLGVNLDRCPFEQIEAELVSDERVVFCFGALYEKAVALTNYRLIHAETKNPAHDQQGGVKIVCYDRISVVFSGNMLLHISVTGQEELVYGNFAMDKIRAAAETIGDVIQKFKRKISGVGAVLPLAATAADELKKYKELLDMGAISQPEYEAKKKQLLGL